MPKKLRERPVRIEAWGRFPSMGFKVVGVTEPGGRYTENHAGTSGIGRERAHILLVPGQCASVRIMRGWKMSGRWKIRFVDAMIAEPLPPKVKATVSQLFQCPAPGTRIAATFGDAGGRLAIYNEKGRRIATLTGREHRFDDVVVVPDVKGLLAVEGPESKWGPMTRWSLRTENPTATR
ncbi:hypothetical protein ACIO1C_27170 [Streptomyces sp. NPDC087420]|uniref:hypothetical protein n=1 Tax=Streptomyces sp. NPDC087420 TaxID=3365785 RepID=UPI0038347E8E